jgi:hypothetical protein
VTTGRNAVRSGGGSTTGANKRPRGKRRVCSHGRWEENGGREKGAWEAATPILKGSVAWSRGGGGWLGVAPHGEEVGRGVGGQHVGRVARSADNGPRPTGVGAGGATMPRGRSKQGRGREADRWGRAT